jgi:hypothetical protein
MKYTLIGLLTLISASAFGSSPVVTCELDYTDLIGNGYGSVIFNDVGRYSVNDCVRAATAARKKSSSSVTFIFSHYTRTSSSNVKENSEGWELSSEIVHQNITPDTLKYKEFVNP